MVWHDVGLALLGCFCYGVAAALFVVIAALLGRLVALVLPGWPWKKPLPPPIEFQAELGTFLKVADDWEWEGPEWTIVTVRDVDGAPDPNFLARLPALLADLPRLEEIARAGYDFEGAADPLEWGTFGLDGLEQGEGETVVLNFRNENALAAVRVALLGKEVVDAVLAD